MKLLIQLCSVVVLILCSQHINAETVITVSQSNSAKQPVSLQYKQSPRLVQVIKDSLENSAPLATQHKSLAIYWLAAGLYDYSTEAEFQQKQQQIIHLLKTQYDDMETPQNIKALKTLSAWFTANQFMKRELILLDYDSIRLKDELNPLLTGRYLLTLPSKPENVLVLGAVEQNGSQPFIVRQGATEYLNNAIPLDDSESSYAWLIQPDGKLEHYPIAYWNQHHIDIAPGAIIYLDFQGVRDNEQQLNQQILELLRHW
ncbi:capsule biosynthesis GfcC family protein, partial [Shewanella sp. SG41-4]|uniref:capsule biosynthesis GfcC family protein n=1 Tax=Shewanella sp. SG41-4 TaxID=2760976 RepID=UPI0015FF1D65